MNERTALYRARGFPVLQNRVYATREQALACPTGDIELVQHAATGVVHNRAFDPSRVVYDAEYQNEQALSPGFMAHLERVREIVLAALQDPIVEVGCGKGTFLELLRASGRDAVGMDPAYEGDSPHVRKQSFAPGCGVRAKGVVLRHVLEHVPDPHAFLSGLARACGGRGRLYVEVPCLDWILDRRAWFDVFYEHVNYFRMDDFRRLFGEIVETGRLFGGQYLYAVVELGSLREPAFGAAVEWPADFLDPLETVAEGIRRFHRQSGRAPWAWGASSKGVVFSLLMRRMGVPLAGLVDINPVKQGRFAPVTGLPIVSPERMREHARRGDLLLVMNGNYLGEIREMTGHRFDCLAVDSVGRSGLSFRL